MDFLILVGLILGVYFSITYFTNSKKETEYKKRLNESLSNEYLVDPETGKKLNLEFDDFGNPIITDTNQLLNQSDINYLPSQEDKQIEIALKYLRESSEHAPTELTSHQLFLFHNTKLLSKYESWSYSNPWNFKGGILFFPAPEIRGVIRGESNYSESQLMYWRKINNTLGHYYLREKTFSEKFTDKIKIDDDLILTNYECFTYRKGKKLNEAQRVASAFESELDLEIEIHNDNLFVKTLKLVSKGDMIRIEKVLKTLGNIVYN